MKKEVQISQTPKKLMLNFFAGVLLFNLLILGLTSSFNMENSLFESKELEAAFSKSNQLFTFKLHKELTSRNNGNVFFSPFSISTALSMTLLGAKDQTAQQMVDTLGVSGLKDTIHEAFEKYLSVILEENEYFTLHTANRLFPNHLMKVEDDFVNRCKKNYMADVLPLDFSKAENAMKIINDWVSEKTKEKIKDLIAPGILSPNVFMVLVNAIYFKGNWASQFDKEKTHNAMFHINFSEEVEVDMMYQKRKFFYTYHPGYLCSVLEMPYKGEGLSMVFILPDTLDGLSIIEDKLTPDMFNELQDRLRNKSDVEVYIPKFKLETQFELSTVLSKLGMQDAFSDSADFSGMDKKKEVFISNVIHKAFVEINEEGTEAAAATAVVMMKRAAVRNPVFKADKPFLFFIKDRRTNIILFSGRFVRPEGDAFKSTRDEL